MVKINKKEKKVVFEGKTTLLWGMIAIFVFGIIAVLFALNQTGFATANKNAGAQKPVDITVIVNQSKATSKSGARVLLVFADVGEEFVGANNLWPEDVASIEAIKSCNTSGSGMCILKSVPRGNYVLIAVKNNCSSNVQSITVGTQKATKTVSLQCVSQSVKSKKTPSTSTASRSTTTTPTCSDKTKLNACNLIGQKCLEAPRETEAEIKIIADGKFELYLNNNLTKAQISPAMENEEVNNLLAERKIGEQKIPGTLATYAVKIKDGDILFVYVHDLTVGTKKDSGLMLEISAGGQIIEQTNTAWKAVNIESETEKLEPITVDLDESTLFAAERGYKPFNGFDAKTQSIWFKTNKSIGFRKKISLSPPKEIKLANKCSECNCQTNYSCSYEQCIKFIPDDDALPFQECVITGNTSVCANIRDSDARDFGITIAASQIAAKKINNSLEQSLELCNTVSASNKPECEKRAKISATGNITQTQTETITTSTTTEQALTNSGAQQATTPIYPTEAYECKKYIRVTKQTISDYITTNCVKISETELQAVKSMDKKALAYINQESTGMAFKFETINKTKTSAELVGILLYPDGTQKTAHGYDLDKLINNGATEMRERIDNSQQLGGREYSYAQTEIENGELFVFFKRIGLTTLVRTGSDTSSRTSTETGIDEIKIAKIA